MHYLLFFFTILSFSSFASESHTAIKVGCEESVSAIKSKAELFVIELNMDRVEMLFYLRKKLNIDGGIESQTALDEELYLSIMEVLVKPKSPLYMISRIAEIKLTFKDFPLKISQVKLKELNSRLTLRL